jgi:hypothetical protein
MCNTITSASPSRPSCSLCVLDNEENLPWRAWDRAVREASADGSIFRDLCDEHKEEVEEWEAEVDEDDGGPDGPPVDEDGEAFYGHDLDGYMGEEGY